MRASPDTLPLLAVIKNLTVMVQNLEKKIEDLSRKVDDMQEEWRTEYSVASTEESDESEWEESDESEWEESDESECEMDSVYSAPATFSYKVQRIE